MKGKIIKKLTAYALTAAMVVSTPMTAFASEFADNFWYSDGSNPDGESAETQEGGELGTGTVTVTGTGTTDLSMYDIARIAIDPLSVVVDSGNKVTLTVTAYDSADKAITDEKVVTAINSQFEWRTSNYSVARPKVTKPNRHKCEVTGYKGGFATITVGLNVNPQTGKEKEYDFTAKCRIMVRKNVTAVNLNLPNGGKLYAGHTYDLTDYITFGADDEFDEVTFSFTPEGDSKKFAKFITYTDDGFVKVDKKTKNGLTAKVVATAGNGVKSAEQTITFDEGVPVTGLAFTAPSKAKTNTAYDIADKKYDKSTGAIKPTVYNQAEVTIKTKSGATTDDITWESSDPTIVRVLRVEGEPFNQKTETLSEKDKAEPTRKVRFEGLNVGKAAVTVTSTSGKSAKLNVTVTATLIKIESAKVDNNKTYSGKATSLVIKRVPAQNQDKLKIVPKSKSNKLKGIKVKAAITPVLTPGTDLDKVSVGDAKASNGTLTVANEILRVEQSKKNKGASAAIGCDVTGFTIEQSDVKLPADKNLGVVMGNGTALTSKTTIKVNPVKTLTYFASLDNSYTHKPGVDAVSWESSKETVATIVGDGRIKVVGQGKAKITVSASYRNGKSYKTIKKTFNIQATPKCEKLVLKSDAVKVKAGKDAVINVSKQLPNKAADRITCWYYGKDGKWTQTGVTVKNNKITIKGLTAGTYTVVLTAGSAEATAKVVVQ